MGLFDKLRNSTLTAAIADSPAVATASGWHKDSKTGKVVQERTKADEQLGENLGTLAMAEDILIDPAGAFKPLQLVANPRKLYKSIQSVMSTPKIPMFRTSSATHESLKSVGEAYKTDALQALTDFYQSDEYLKRLLSAGFTEEEAVARIGQMIKNMQSAVTDYQKLPKGISGATEINPADLSKVRIIIDPDKIHSPSQYNTVMREELTHAGELNGYNQAVLENILKQSGYTVESLQKEDPKLYQTLLDQLELPEYKALNIQKALDYNSSLGGEVDMTGVLKNKLADASDTEAASLLYRYKQAKDKEAFLKNELDYFTSPTEKRARGINWVIDSNNGGVPVKSRLGKEAESIYLNNQNYLNKVIGTSALLAPLTTEKKCNGGLMNYLNYIKL